MIIAIDGPAGSGKSTTARAVSRRLGYLYVDTGAMYRTVALAVFRARRQNPDTEIDDLLNEIDIRFESADDSLQVMLNGENVTEEIRSPEISRMASEVAKVSSVRAAMVPKQREIVAQAVAVGSGAVVEGRDIGTVVFPDADLKIFLDADVAERARRRQKDLSLTGRSVSENDVARQLTERDAEDRSRDLAPLKAADDARHLDTTSLTFEEQVEKIVQWAESAVRRTPA